MSEEVINEYWPRVKAVIEYSGLPSINRFAKHIGLPVAENLYRIKRGQNGISRALADRIVRHYPQISKGWLLCGEGPMLHDLPALSAEAEALASGGAALGSAIE